MKNQSNQEENVTVVAVIAVAKGKRVGVIVKYVLQRRAEGKKNITTITTMIAREEEIAVDAAGISLVSN